MVKLASAAVDVPTGLVYVLSEYHLQMAPFPKLPPLWVRLILLPEQITAGETLKEDGAVDGGITVMVADPDWAWEQLAASCTLSRL